MRAWWPTSGGATCVREPLNGPHDRAGREGERREKGGEGERREQAGGENVKFLLREFADTTAMPIPIAKNPIDV